MRYDTRTSSHNKNSSSRGAHRFWAYINGPVVHRLLVLLALLALVTSFVGWFVHSSQTSFAKSRSFQTCATALPQERPSLCTGTDPILEGCSADAKTVAHQPIWYQGTVVGLAEVRHSATCDTSWGRGFSALAGTALSVYISNLGTEDAASYLSSSTEVYSNMVYATLPTVTIQIDVSPTQTAGTTIAGVSAE